MRAAIVGLALACAPAASGPTPDFVSPCGVLVFDTQDAAGFAAAEARALRALETAAGLDADASCERLDGLELAVRNPGGQGVGEWTDSAGHVHTGGIAFCPSGIVLATDDWASGALTHEIAHILTDCAGGESHQGWEEQGLFNAVALTTKGN